MMGLLLMLQLLLYMFGSGVDVLPRATKLRRTYPHFGPWPKSQKSARYTRRERLLRRGGWFIHGKARRAEAKYSGSRRPSAEVPGAAADGRCNRPVCSFSGA